MKRFLHICIALLCMVVSMAATTAHYERSKSVAYVEGVRYLIHPVGQGETLYGLTKLYEIGEEQLLEANPILREGLKSGMTIKIPYPIEEQQDGEKELSSRKLRKRFDPHIIAAGETLYSISKRYGVAIDVIMEDNPSLDITTLKIGESINIRKSEQGQSSNEQIKSELEEYRELLNKVAPEGMIYYTIDSDDTLSSITEEFKMSEEQLFEINNLQQRGVDALAQGAIILVRDPDSLLIEQPQDVMLDYEAKAFGGFTALNRSDTLEISLLLPLSVRTNSLTPFAEFYKGFLLGVEDLKNEGRNVVVNLFDTERDASHVAAIINDDGFKRSNLIIGPIYEELLAPVLTYAEAHSIPLVSPLATLTRSESPSLFQMAPSPEHRYDKIDQLLTPKQSVTLIYGESRNMAYDAEVRKMLSERNIPFSSSFYRYQHSSEVQQSKEAAEKRIERAIAAAAAAGEDVDQGLIDSLSYRYSMSELTHLIINGEEHNIFFIISSNETEVDRILSALSSAKASQESKIRGRTSRYNDPVMARRAPSRYNVVANPNWRDYKNIDKSLYFKNGVITFPSYYAGRESEAVREFDGRYAEQYNLIPTLYSYRGYDVAKIFGEGLYSDIQYGMEGKVHTPLLNGYRFTQESRSEGNATKHSNINWPMVIYKSDYTLSVE